MFQIGWFCFYGEKYYIEWQEQMRTRHHDNAYYFGLIRRPLADLFIIPGETAILEQLKEKLSKEHLDLLMGLGSLLTVQKLAEQIKFDVLRTDNRDFAKLTKARQLEADCEEQIKKLVDGTSTLSFLTFAAEIAVALVAIRNERSVGQLASIYRAWRSEVRQVSGRCMQELEMLRFVRAQR